MLSIKKNILWFFLLHLILTSSCVSFKPTPFEFTKPETYQKVKEAPEISYHIYEINPDTADLLFDYEDLRGKGIAPFMLQVDNNTSENLIFEAGQIAGMVTNQEVHKTTRPSPWVFLTSEVFGGTIVSYLAASNWYIVGAVSAATLGHVAYVLGTNAKRRKYIANQAPLAARVPANIMADIVFFMDTLPTENAYIRLIGENSNKIYKLPVPAERIYDARFIYINAAKAIRAEKGQTLQSLAKKYALSEDQIYSYNEVTPPRFPELQDGDTVYISKKRGKAEEVNHIVQEGDTMRKIAHLYAIRMADLHKMNRMLIGQQPAIGEEIFLRKKRKNAPLLSITGKKEGQW